MKRFVKFVGLFILPVIFLLLPVFLLLYNSKEAFFDVDNLLTKKTSYIYGLMYDEENYKYFKWSQLQHSKKKCVWAIGSSRVLPFRSNMFDSTFYNAGYTTKSINYFLPFLKSISIDKYPKYLILGLDQWGFVETQWYNLDSIPNGNYWEKRPSILPTKKVLTNVYKDILNKKYLLRDFFYSNNNYYGLNANIKKSGFRNDGSMYYGMQIEKLLNNDTSAADYKYQDTFDRINHGYKGFDHKDNVDKRVLIKLDSILSFCKSNHIEVVGFLPPFADAVHQKMISSDNYGYLKQIYSDIKPIFQKFNFEIYDFSSQSKCNSNDTEVMDGGHGSEVTYQRMLIKILEQKSKLNKVCNNEKLKNNLKNRLNRYTVYY